MSDCDWIKKEVVEEEGMEVKPLSIDATSVKKEKGQGSSATAKYSRKRGRRMTPEEKRKRHRENQRRRRAALREQALVEETLSAVKQEGEVDNVKGKRRKGRMTEEEKSKRNLELKKARWRKLMSDPEKREEIKRQNSFNRYLKMASMTEEEMEVYRAKEYLRNHAYYRKKGRWSDRPVEEREKLKAYWREWELNLEGEKRERHMECLRRSAKKFQERLKTEQPEKWREKHDKFLEYQRSKYAKETGDERERRRHKEKVNAARRKLKKQLEGEGVGKEEIERRDEELRVMMWKEFDPEGEVPPKKPGRRSQKVKPDVKVDEVPGCSSKNCAPGPSMSPPSPPQSPICPPSPPIPDFDGFGDSFDFEPETEDPVASTLQCPHCTFACFQDTDLQDHLSSCHPDKCWKCPKCGDVMASPQELSKHYQTSHKKTEVISPPPTSELNFFCMRCLPPPTTTSGQSGVTGFKGRSELLGHVKDKHPESHWPCQRCYILKYSERALQLHLSLCQRQDQ